MTIPLPKDVENSVLAKVESGLFHSVDAAMTEAARLLMERIEQKQSFLGSEPAAAEETPDLLIGSMSDHCKLIDEIVEEALRAGAGAECPRLRPSASSRLNFWVKPLQFDPRRVPLVVPDKCSSST